MTLQPISILSACTTATNAKMTRVGSCEGFIAWPLARIQPAIGSGVPNAGPSISPSIIAPPQDYSRIKRESQANVQAHSGQINQRRVRASINENIEGESTRHEEQDAKKLQQSHPLL